MRHDQSLSTLTILLAGALLMLSAGDPTGCVSTGSSPDSKRKNEACFFTGRGYNLLPGRKNAF